MYRTRTLQLWAEWEHSPLSGVLETAQASDGADKVFLLNSAWAKRGQQGFFLEVKEPCKMHRGKMAAEPRHSLLEGFLIRHRCTGRAGESRDAFWYQGLGPCVQGFQEVPCLGLRRFVLLTQIPYHCWFPWRR